MWLTLENLSKNYPGPVQALDRVSLSIGKGEFFAIVGPTNAGKSTLLKAIAGVEFASCETLRLAGRDLRALEPRERGVSLLFQNIALFPNRTGYENIAFPMRVAKRSDAEIKARVAEVSTLLKVDHLLGRLPRTFSGGEQQRVAIARSIVMPADLLMLDEPLTNLDARIRIALRRAFKELHRDSGQTMLYVTHDQAEALSLADRVGILHEGRFVQMGTPEDVYRHPANAFVARFLGSPPMNILDVELQKTGDDLRAVCQGLQLRIDGKADAIGTIPARASIGVRPEEIVVSPRESQETPVAGEVAWVERLGSHQILDVVLGRQSIRVRTRPDHPIRREGPAWFGFRVATSRILDRDTGLFMRGISDPSDPH